LAAAVAMLDGSLWMASEYIGAKYILNINSSGGVGAGD
jgi:hypothetical protein